MLLDLQRGTDYTVSFSHLEIGFVLTLAFAIAARFMRAVTLGGAIAGAVISFVLFVAAGPGAFLALVTVFVLAWITTRLGYARKQRLGTAEAKEGRRTSQVLANLAVAGATGLLAAVLHWREIAL